MPFRPKLLTDVPSGTPDVQIFFHGQLLLRSEDGATCEVGTNPVATKHVLTIEVRTKTPGKPDLINMRHVGPLHFRPREGMLIEVGNPAAASPAAWKCVTLDSVNYETGNPPPPAEDFRWILNLEGGLFHGRELDPPLFRTQHVIRLQGGEYFFRTAARADDRLEYVRKGGGKPDMTFRRIGAVASASLFLVDRQSVILRWQDGSQEADRVLTLTKALNTTYEIYIENTPLYQEFPPESELPNHDELVEYYKVIQEIPAGNRFKFVPTLPRIVRQEAAQSCDPADSTEGKLRDGETGSPSIPCQVMTLDGAAN